MTDVMTPEKRSAVMSRIRGRDTAPEMQIRRILWHTGLRFRLNVKRLPGSPDIVLPKWRAVVFVHGCFWHRHEGCALFRLPATRTAFWDAKLMANRRRDERSTQALLALQWRVLVVWECAIKLSPANVGERLVTRIRNDSPSAELVRDGANVRWVKLAAPL